MTDGQAGQKRQAEATRVDEAITTLIEDLHSRGQLSDEQLNGVVGGFGIKVTVSKPVGGKCYENTTVFYPASSTANDDTDYKAE